MTKPIPLPEESKYIDTSKWQDSSDPIERMAYWINWLSPHNLWKSKSALQEMLSQAQQEAVERERSRIDKLMNRFEKTNRKITDKIAGWYWLRSQLREALQTKGQDD